MNLAKIVTIMILFAVMFACGHHVTKDEFSVLPNKGLQSSHPDKANIYILFPEKDKADWSYAVYRDSDVIGAIAGGTYFYDVVKPGKYKYWLDSGLFEKSRELVELTVMGGKNYYIRYFPGGFYVVAKLDLISEDVALAYINGLNYIELKQR